MSEIKVPGEDVILYNYAHRDLPVAGDSLFLSLIDLNVMNDDWLWFATTTVIPSKLPNSPLSPLYAAEI